MRWRRSGFHRSSPCWPTWVSWQKRCPPTGLDQPQSEIEVLGQRPRGPGNARKGRQRAQSGELPVATEARRADAVPRHLHEPAEADELHVLHPREDAVVSVVDAHPDLDRPHLGIAEIGRDDLEASRLQSTVGVDDGQHDIVGGPAGDPLLLLLAPTSHCPVRGVQDVALALTRFRGPSVEDPHPRVHRRRSMDDLAGPVRRPVVDDEHPVGAAVDEAGQIVQRRLEHQFLVASRHQDDDERQLVDGAEPTDRAAGRAPGAGPAHREEHGVVHDDGEDGVARHREIDGHMRPRRDGRDGARWVKRPRPIASGTATAASRPTGSGGSTCRSTSMPYASGCRRFGGS